jgi:hypothetical protein
MRDYLLAALVVIALAVGTSSFCNLPMSVVDAPVPEAKC